MNYMDRKNNRILTPLFDYIKNQLVSNSFWIHDENSKETYQFYKDQHSYLQGEPLLGAIQYEGSFDIEKKEPDKVSLRVYRSNKTKALEVDLEKIAEPSFDTNKGPYISHLPSLIAFKFQKMEENDKSLIKDIIYLLKKHKDNGEI